VTFYASKRIHYVPVQALPLDLSGFAAAGHPVFLS